MGLWDFYNNNSSIVGGRGIARILLGRVSVCLANRLIKLIVMRLSQLNTWAAGTRPEQTSKGSFWGCCWCGAWWLWSDP